MGKSIYVREVIKQMLIVVPVLLMLTNAAIAQGKVYPPQKEITVDIPGYAVKVIATAYTPMEEGQTSGTGLAFDGRPAIPYLTLAVDPRVIPLGSMVYVPGYGWMRAHDTGSAIKGARIDLCLATDLEMREFGVREMEIYVVVPGER